MSLEQHLKRYFGHDQFRTGQKEIITSIINGKDTLAMLPTGTGKSLCYQMAGYLLEGSVLVVSPLLSLMQDQVEQMKAMGEKRVVAINSFLSYMEKKTVLSNLDKYKFIYISPEMLSNPEVIPFIRRITLSLFVVDEAHCISQWGHDFRPDYSSLGNIRTELGSPVTLALTATASNEVRKDILGILKLKSPDCWVFSVDRPNIGLIVQKVPSFQEKTNRLLQLVHDLQGPGIIYFSSKKIADETAMLIRQENNERVAAYHGGLDQEQRILIQQQFLYGQLDIICATSAFGMGINKENVRYVIHFHMPPTLESYLQEIGRAGRDGQESIAIYLSAPYDDQLPEQLIEGELPTEIQIDEFYSKIASGMDWKECELSLQLTEIQSRFLLHFKNRRHELDHLELAEAVKDHCQNRITQKLMKLKELNAWMQSSDCRRAGILEYFEEDKQPSVEKCCDNCGLDLRYYLKSDEKEEDSSSIGDWELILKNILLNETV
ncbi:RecQ family ATP-dependent DNA helicase [Falsibacillus pallidus]|uniref:ATP-dependent DNA helicase RecQ n=1 Tax=Falsibacillus pallidus TaxID=493781 RepID=A0A370GGN3_9BACI|nr:ATP-dependent DNA helicase RecQ [Falsibacillus pallidus]RDI42955.1 ATP-dependent DNA helicase RecQ [Falsibacillus pallidus]